MKVILKFGGTSISSASKLKEVSKYLFSISKKNQIVTVFSAVSGTTDDLLLISDYIRKNDKKKANVIFAKIKNKHTQIAKECVPKKNVQKKLLSDLNSEFEELEELIQGMILIGEVTPRSLDYLISFGERFSIT